MDLSLPPRAPRALRSAALLAWLLLGACSTPSAFRQLPQWCPVASPPPPPPLGPPPAYTLVDAAAEAAPDVGVPLVPRAELCGNGVDDNGNGAADEGCECAVGTTARCYQGPESVAGVGACAFGSHRCEATPGGGGAWGPCTGSVAPSEEVPDGLDNDCDGLVDEQLACTPGVTECFHGAASQRGVGPCRAGLAVCVGDSSPDAPQRSVSEGVHCLGEVSPSLEVCDGVDNDCNGSVDDLTERCDGIDNDCDGVVDNGCAALSPTSMYRYGRFGTQGSGVWRGSEHSMLQLTVVPLTCAPGTVSVELRDRREVCAPTPPGCGAGQQLDYDEGHGWSCVPCELVIQYGAIYDFERVCAPRVRLRCWEGTMPTFLVERRRWECRRPCDNTLYDRTIAEGVPACIPC